MTRSFYISMPTPAVPIDLDNIPVQSPALSNITAQDLTISFGTMLFQALKANAADFLVAAKKDAGAKLVAPIAAGAAPFYGFRADPGDTAPPIFFQRGQGAALRLSDFTVLGAAGETLLITAVED